MAVAAGKCRWAALIVQSPAGMCDGWVPMVAGRRIRRAPLQALRPSIEPAFPELGPELSPGTSGVRCGARCKAQRARRLPGVARWWIWRSVGRFCLDVLMARPGEADR